MHRGNRGEVEPERKGELMEAKEYLLQIKQIKTKMAIIKEELEDLQAKLGAQAIRYDTEPHGQGDDERQAHLIYKLIDAKDKLVLQQLELLEKEAEIRDTLFQLEDARQIQVLYLRYFKLMKWTPMAQQLHYSDRRIKEWHFFGLLSLQDILEKSA